MVKPFYLTPIDGTLTCTASPGQSEPKSNGDEEVFHISRSFATENSPFNDLVSYQDVR